MAREPKNFLSHRLYDRHMAEVAPLAHGRLLDIGCGLKPERERFAPYVIEHVGVDHAESPHGTSAADIVASAYDIPVPSGSFDTVLCTCVLEHLEEPLAGLREARRVLRTGGVAIYDIPFIWQIHEAPRDFYRFSRYGIRYLFEAAGFHVEQLRAQSGFIATFGQMSVYWLYRFHRGPMRLVPVIPLLGSAIQWCALAADRFDRSEGWTYGYLVVARAR